jgi:hypothetical protein
MYLQFLLNLASELVLLHNCLQHSHLHCIFCPLPFCQYDSHILFHFLFIGIPCDMYLQISISVSFPLYVQGPFAKFVNSPYYSESELREDGLTMSFSK